MTSTSESEALSAMAFSEVQFIMGILGQFLPRFINLRHMELYCLVATESLIVSLLTSHQESPALLPMSSPEPNPTFWQDGPSMQEKGQQPSLSSKLRTPETPKH